MDLPETDSEDEIPPGWEERCTSDGLVFYASHESKTTQWKHPRTGKKKRVTGELPFGWERQVDEHGMVVFTDHANQKTSYTDPRLAFAVEVTESPDDLRQRYDSESTGLHITHGRDLSDKVAIITGANSGIGYETARSLAYRGCRVIFACRDENKADESISRLKKEKSYVDCHFLHVDLCSLRSVKAFVIDFKQIFRRCDILILNAGVFGIPFELTEDGLEQNFQVNFLSHLYLALLIQPLMCGSSFGRIVFVSAESHRFSSLSSASKLMDELCPKKADYLATVAYNNSKLCAVLGCLEIHRRFADFGIKCYAVHPGNLVNTNLPRYWYPYKILFSMISPFTKSTQQACAPSVYCAVSPEVSKCSGMYVNNCVPCIPSEEALDPILANRLWTISLILIEDRLGKKAFQSDD